MIGIEAYNIVYLSMEMKKMKPKHLKTALILSCLAVLLMLLVGVCVADKTGPTTEKLPELSKADKEKWTQYLSTFYYHAYAGNQSPVSLWDHNELEGNHTVRNGDKYGDIIIDAQMWATGEGVSEQLYGTDRWHILKDGHRNTIRILSMKHVAATDTMWLKAVLKGNKGRGVADVTFWLPFRR